ncbi:MAG: hypothetical protein COA92_05465 [Sulfurovum sp.]|nr:MAG: hypothetical protein COA92_05465 [Sulfurovum sp.]
MKNIVLIIILFTNSIYATLNVDQIREMVTKIHEKREGISLETLISTKEPFVRLQEEDNVTTFVIPVQVEETKMSLHAILNQKAYINNQWRGIDDVIGGYTLKYIGKKGVVLRNDNQIKKLFLHKEGKNFIMINER